MSSRPFDLESLKILGLRSPAWRLVSVTHSPFIISVLHKIFIADQLRRVPEGEFLRILDDHLIAARLDPDVTTYRRTAKAYLDEWASDACGWVRSSYLPGSDEPVFDLTSGARRAIEWVASLENRSFVGTESRLLTVIELLKQIRLGSEKDDAVRLKELELKRAEIEAEILKVTRGIVEPMSDAVVRDRFQMAADNANSLLSDLAEVEHNFRKLDREIRTRIAEWDGSKGALLEEIFRRRNAITDSDQGRSFHAFYEFLMSPRRKDEMEALLEAVLALPSLRDQVDDLLPHIRYEWWRAAEQAQRTIAKLSEQLRCFLVERTALENRRIIQIMREIERNASRVRECPPDYEVMSIDEPAPSIALPMDRPMFTPPIVARFDDAVVEIGVADADTAPLFNQVYIDPRLLAAHIEDCLVEAEVVSLVTVVTDHPLTHGVAELMGYLRLASTEGGTPKGFISDGEYDVIAWTDSDLGPRRARVPRVIFHR